MTGNIWSSFWYNAVTDYKQNKRPVHAVQHRSIKTLCRDIQTYEMIKIDLDQVPTCPFPPLLLSLPRSLMVRPTSS